MRIFWKQGIASEAVAEVTRYLLKEEQIEQVHAWCHFENTASRYVLEKAGFRHTETLSGVMKNEDGSCSDQVVYRIYRGRPEKC